jgi:hypothetical protein
MIVCAVEYVTRRIIKNVESESESLKESPPLDTILSQFSPNYLF